MWGKKTGCFVGLLLLTACAIINDETVPGFSTGELCEFLGPDWINLPSENGAIHRELEKRKARCAGGYVVDYGVSRSSAEAEDRGQSSGSGVIVNLAGAIVTNNHVIDGCETIHVMHLHEKLKAKIVAQDGTNDVAVIKIDRETPQYAEFRATNDLGLAEPVMVLGYPLRGLLADQLNATSGDVTSLAGLGGDTRFFQTSAPVQPGNSGGPVFDQRGAVVGLATSKLDAMKVAAITGDIPQNINFGIKALMVTSLLDANEVSYTRSQSPKHLSRQEIARNGSALVVSVLCNDGK